MTDSTTNQTAGMATYTSKMGQFAQRVNSHVKSFKRFGVDETETLAGLKNPEVVLDFDKRMTSTDEDVSELCKAMPFFTAQATADKLIQATREKGFSGVKARQFKMGDDTFSDSDDD